MKTVLQPKYEKMVQGSTSDPQVKYKVTIITEKWIIITEYIIEYEKRYVQLYL